jgi:hypothetical protein
MRSVSPAPSFRFLFGICLAVACGGSESSPGSQPDGGGTAGASASAAGSAGSTVADGGRASVTGSSGSSAADGGGGGNGGTGEGGQGGRGGSGEGGRGGSGTTDTDASDAAPDSSSSTSSSGATGGSGGTGISIGVGGSAIPDANCGAVRQSATQVPDDLFIMQDRSASMDCPAADDFCTTAPLPLVVHPTRWDATTQALSEFVASTRTAGLGIGIGFFGAAGAAACATASYATPTVPIAPLPANALAITSAVAAVVPTGNTPSTPALTGAIEYARAYTMSQMGSRRAAVLFVSDGIPAGCNSTVTNAAAAAAAGFNGSPSIKTYVIGLANPAGLDEIALAGSGGTTHYIPAAGDVVGAVVNALTSISGALTCAYSPPADFNPYLVNLEVTIGATGTPSLIGKVDNLAACGASGGWYYDVNPPLRPSQIQLCAQSCDQLRGTPNSTVNVLVGCPSSPSP